MSLAASALPFYRCIHSNSFTHARGHADSGLHVANKGNDFKLVLRSSQLLRAEETHFRHLYVRGWAAGVAVVLGFLLSENRPLHPMSCGQLLGWLVPRLKRTKSDQNVHSRYFLWLPHYLKTLRYGTRI